jgi:Xaa-Pro aminopeptidase
MHSVVKRGALYWDRDLCPASAFTNRIAAIQERITTHRDAAWLLVGDVIRHGPVVYATNFMPRVRSALVFIPANGAPTLFANISLRDVPAARLITDVEDIRPFSRLPKDLSSFIAERLPQGGVIGTCGVEDCLPANDWWAIDESLPLVEWAPRDGEIATMRAAKDAFEVAAIQRSMDLANLGLDAAPDLLRGWRDACQSSGECPVAKQRGNNAYKTRGGAQN